MNVKESFPGQAWWMQLSSVWKQAYAETFFHHDRVPSETELKNLYHSPVLRLAGPSAAFPNMSFELTDITGIEPLVNLEILVVTHHSIESLGLISGLTKLRSLFIFNNRLKNLEGVEQLRELELLYAQCNRIDSIAPVQQLLNLKEFYINDNCVASLEGLTEQHADNLEAFFCKPNYLLKQKEMLRVERELGVRCRNI